MSETTIILKDVIGTDLGPRNKIETLFNNIDKNSSKVIMDFEGIEFMGRSFAQEYLNQKHISTFEIIEVNLSEDIKEMFNMIMKLNNKK